MSLPAPPPTAAPARRAGARKESPKKAETRLRILDAAARVFSRHGYQAARLRDVAEEAGLHLTALYYHFNNKDDLAEAMMNRLALKGRALIDAALAELPPAASFRQRIAAAARAQLTAMLADTDYMAAHAKVLQQVPEEVAARHRLVLHQTSAIWRDLMRGARDSGEIGAAVDPGIATQLLLGSLNWSAQWYRPGPLSPAQIAESAIAMTFDGLRPR